MSRREVGPTTFLHYVIRLAEVIPQGCRIRVSDHRCGETADHFHSYWEITRFGAKHRGTPLCQLHAERVATAAHCAIDIQEKTIVRDVRRDPLRFLTEPKKGKQ